MFLSAISIMQLEIKVGNMVVLSKNSFQYEILVTQVQCNMTNVTLIIPNLLLGKNTPFGNNPYVIS